MPGFLAVLEDEEAPAALAVQADGKVIVGGLDGRVFRLNADGSRDDTFPEPVLPLVSLYKIRLTADGKVLVHGASSEDRSNPTLVRLTAEGELDGEFNPGFVARSERVRAFAPLPDGSVVYQGDINQGGRRSHIKRLRSDGSIDPTFPTVEIEDVEDIIIAADGTFLVGGSFDEVNGEAVSEFVRLSKDGVLLAAPALNLKGLNNRVPVIYSIAETATGQIIIGGVFNEIGGREQAHVARLNADGTLDRSFVPPLLNRDLRSVLLDQEGRIILLGTFTQAGTSFRQSIVRLESGGRLDDGFALGPVPYRIVRAAAIGRDGRLLVALYHIDSAGAAVEGIYSAVLNTYPLTPPSIAITPGSQSRILGERLELGIPVRSFRTAYFQWRFNGGDIPDATNSFLSFSRLTFGDSGTYTLIASNRLGRVTSPPVDVVVNAAPVLAGSVDPSFDPGAGFEQRVTALAIQGEEIVAAGAFESYDGNAATNLARISRTGAFDDTFDAGSGFSPIFTCDVLVAMPDGKLYVGADFSRFNGMPARAVVRLKANGELDTGFAPTFPIGAAVGDMHAVADGDLLVAGCPDFQCSESVWRMKPDGAIDSGFNTDSRFSINSSREKLALQRDGKILVAGGLLAAGLLRLMPDGSRDSSFQSPAELSSAQISSILELADGRILVGSRFGTPLFLLKENGALAAQLHFGFGVNRLHLLPNGEVLAAGLNTLQRLTAGLARDTNFVCGVNGIILAMAVQPDGNIVIAGDFTTVNGMLRNRIARVFGSEQAPEPFILSSAVSDGEFELRVPTVKGRVYRLEWKGELGETEWKALPSMTGDGSHQTISDSSPGAGRRFYRVRAE